MSEQVVFTDRKEALTVLSERTGHSIWHGTINNQERWVVADGKHKAVAALLAVVCPTFRKPPQSTINAWLLAEMRSGKGGEA